MSLAEWRRTYGDKITIVIAAANGLATAINSADATRIKISCDALKDNYRTYLQPIPDPPGALGKTGGKWEEAQDEIYAAQSHCSSGFLHKSDFYASYRAAKSGIALLNEVLG